MCTRSCPKGKYGFPFLPHQTQQLTDETRSLSVCKIDVPNFTQQVGAISLSTPLTALPLQKNVIVSLPMILSFLLTGCSVIKSDVFAECHPVVSPNKYFDACRHETCLCHQGGDCGCFCSAVANYARACNQHGISVLWRREGFCGKRC